MASVIVENRRLAALIPFNGALYAVTNNYYGNGLGLRRTIDGVNWTLAAAAGFGDSNNTGPYWGNSVTVANNRLYIGTANDANGAEVWATALTADFTATPTRGRPPLTVQFTNTSAGDYTSSQWEFGDGATSPEKNPAHTYTQAGTYTVKLTVSDGTDSNTVTRETVHVGYSLYLPTLMRNYDALLYDNFDDPAWDGAWNPAKWTASWNPALFRVIQQNGSLTFTSGSNVPAAQGAYLQMAAPSERSLKQIKVYEGKLRISSDHQGGWGSVSLFVPADNINGRGWWMQCSLGAGPDRKPGTGCDVYTYVGQNYTGEYNTDAFPSEYDHWYTLRIEADPATAHLRFYRDGQLLGEYTPKDAAALVTATNLRPQVSIWNGDANVVMSRYVDAVRITPAK